MYKIVQCNYYGSRLTLENTWYEVHKRHRFLFWHYWWPMREHTYSGKNPIKFSNIVEARAFRHGLESGEKQCRTEKRKLN